MNIWTKIKLYFIFMFGGFIFLTIGSLLCGLLIPLIIIIFIDIITIFWYKHARDLAKEKGLIE